LDCIIPDDTAELPLPWWERVRERGDIKRYHPPFVPPIKGGKLNINAVNALHKNF
jgi:hypothetical protein